jgi:hypothetical protein
MGESMRERESEKTKGTENVIKEAESRCFPNSYCLHISLKINKHHLGSTPGVYTLKSHPYYIHSHTWCVGAQDFSETAGRNTLFKKHVGMQYKWTCGSSNYIVFFKMRNTFGHPDLLHRTLRCTYVPESVRCIVSLRKRAVLGGS